LPNKWGRFTPVPKYHRWVVPDVFRGYAQRRISDQEWLRRRAREVIEAPGHEPDFSFSSYQHQIADAILGSPFSDIAEPGTGLPDGINSEKFHISLEKTIVLELVHLTDIGISAMTLEGVRQEREHRVYLDRLARSSSSQQGQVLREYEWLRPRLEPYPRRRLKLFLSDGSIELQAIEFEHLFDIELGVTPMGTKVLVSVRLYLSPLMRAQCFPDSAQGYTDCRRHRLPSE